MLLSFSLKNFHSFAEKAEVSFLLTQRDTAEGWVRNSPSGKRFSTAMAVMGPNGAGKSNLIKVGPFLAWFVSDSFALQPNESINFMPHMTRTEVPSEFKAVFEDGAGTEWTYELVISKQRVTFESLHRKESASGSKPVRVFSRVAQGEGYEVRQDLGLADSEAAKVRPNVSLISWAKQYGSELALRVAKLQVASNLDAWDRRGSSRAGLFDAAAFFAQNERQKELMCSLLKRWDFGLSDVQIRKFASRSLDAKELVTTWYPVGVHRVAESEFTLPFMVESSGTQTAFMLLSRLLPILEAGGLAFVDELESDLHPHMIEPLLRIFHEPETNPHNAQIVFTCHSPEVLRHLHRAQITFVEKTQCMSEAYRGDEIEGLTSQHNLYNKYLSGALGAVPQV